MKGSAKLVSVLLVLLLIAANMPPALPSSFWGYTSGITAGQTITAKIVNSTSLASTTQAFTWNGLVVYAMNVTGVSSDEGKAITFKVNGVLVGMGTWHSGTNVRLDLSMLKKKR